MNNWLATVTLGQAGMHATYYHKASDQVSWRECLGCGPVGVPRSPTGQLTCAGPSLPQLQVGVEFEASTRMQDTSASFGYQLDLPKANFLFKGKASSKVRKASVSLLEHRPEVTQLPVWWRPWK